ncbi:MAG: hypothetical protein P1V97_31995 [Planctomycetota bacterium]|nr:hypothetical protein [Planctomycetota bacterium]
MEELLLHGLVLLTLFIISSASAGLSLSFAMIYPKFKNASLMAIVICWSFLAFKYPIFHFDVFFFCFLPLLTLGLFLGAGILKLNSKHPKVLAFPGLILFCINVIIGMLRTLWL